MSFDWQIEHYKKMGRDALAKARQQGYCYLTYEERVLCAQYGQEEANDKLQQTITEQSATIKNLRETVAQQRETINNLQEVILELKTMITNISG